MAHKPYALAGPCRRLGTADTVPRTAGPGPGSGGEESRRAMVVPLAVRIIVAAVGVLLIWTAARSMIGTVIVPRPVGSWLTHWVDKIVSFGYGVAAKAIKDHKRRDRLMAGQAAIILLMQLLAWLAIFFVGYSLLLWPFVISITTALSTAGPALFEIGSEQVAGATERVILDIAALTGIITVTLQIAYLPTLYSAFNRRETEVALLNARAGVPSWGPELLARTHYALGSGVSTIDTLPQLYADWERWAADVTESHTTYLPLVRFRSPRPLSSWVTALLATLDSAALILALSPQQAPTVPARMCLRSGFLCFREIGKAMGFDVPDEPDPAGGMVPALWSGPRRLPGAPIAPIRPPTGRPPTAARDAPIRPPTAAGDK